MTSMKFNFVLSVLFVSVATQAQTVSSKNDGREAQFLTEVAAKADSDQAITQNFLEEIPDGLNTKDISPDCDPKLFEDTVLSKKRSSAEYFKMAKDYFKR